MSSSLTSEDVERIAALAHLDLTADEVERFAGQLATILEYAERLGEVDTAGVDTTWQPPGVPTTPRPDETRPSLPNDAALANAPDPGPGGLFRVPKVLGS